MADMLATPTELAGKLQRDVDTYSATQALEQATGSIQDVLGQTVLQVLNDTVTFDGGERMLYLPQRPVTAVGAITTVDKWGTAYTPVLGTDYRIRSRNTRLIWQGYGRVWPEEVTVTYSHGYASGAIPQAIKRACLSIAAELYRNPTRLKSKTVGGVSWTAQDLTEDEVQLVLAAHQSVMVA